MIVCAFCGGPHVWWDCRKKPEGWKPSKEPLMQPVGEKLPRTSEPQRTRNGDMPTTKSAAPSTHPRTTEAADRDGGGVQSIPAVQSKRGRPPGPVPFDKKAYDRERMAERRAKQKVKE